MGEFCMNYKKIISFLAVTFSFLGLWAMEGQSDQEHAVVATFNVLGNWRKPGVSDYKQVVTGMLASLSKAKAAAKP